MLVVAAQAGFIGGPKCLANMANDSWVPHWFGSLSERLASQNGILLIGAAANQVNILADLGAAGDPVAGESTPAAPSWLVTRRRISKPAAAPAEDTFVQRMRRLTVRTADPSRRPRLTDALREETRRTL